MIWQDVYQANCALDIGGLREAAPTFEKGGRPDYEGLCRMGEGAQPGTTNKEIREVSTWVVSAIFIAVDTKPKDSLVGRRGNWLACAS